jgi:hypothetical protein
VRITLRVPVENNALAVLKLGGTYRLTPTDLQHVRALPSVVACEAV